MSNGRVIVWGSINLDVQIEVEAFPKPGETIRCRARRFGLGGKGANQAVAAARANSATVLGGRVGLDGGLPAMLAAAAPTLDLSRVMVDEAMPSGAAYIMVSEAGENQIVVVGGANERVGVDGLVPMVASDIALAQLEIPIATVDAFFHAARAAGARTVLNASPALDEARMLLPLTDILVVNETELAHFAGRAVSADTIEDVAALAMALLPHETASTVVTLGAAGAVVAHKGAWSRVEGRRANAIDTTGAGDCFCGVMSACLATGQSLGEAVDRANAAAALQVQRKGAADAMPFLHEICKVQ